jgi:uncharacterized damage-inducible protein DinB
MRNFVLLLALSSLAAAQNAAGNPQLASAKVFYDIIKGNVLKSTDKMPEAKYSYKPVDSVRTYGQLLMHIADAQYVFCGTAKGARENKGIEKAALKSKAEIVMALNDAFAFCESTYAGLTDAASAAKVTFIGQEVTKLSVLSLNTAHTYEHYGNLVTYMRMNGIVPPSSEGPPPAPEQKKK